MRIVEFDLMDYPLSVELQRSIVATDISRGPDNVLLLLEHPPTVTLGIRGSLSDLLIPEAQLISAGIAVHVSDRGGQATYHGPGQLVAYPVVSLKSLGLSVRAYVRALEETILQTLGHFGVKAFRKEDTIGIWIGPEEKIASIGVKIRRGIAYHGFSLNVSLEQDPTQFIVCCGMSHTRMISLNQLLVEPVSMKTVRKSVAYFFSRVFNVTLEPCPSQTFLESVFFPPIK
jgi:lipoyl(octanoyl) transferase